jgi:hypothetical protein
MLAVRVAREDPFAKAGIGGHPLVLTECVWYQLRLRGSTPVITGGIIG